MTEEHDVASDAEAAFEDQVALIEALIFASGEPLDMPRLKSISKLKKKDLNAALEALVERYDRPDSGFELRNVGGSYQFRTKGKFAEHLRELRKSRPRRLSPAALETLAIIAYRQPIVRSDIEKIRGVDVTPTLKTVLERKLVKIVGHRATVGQPALYGTTDEFLKLFGLTSLAELPTIRDIRELEADPGEMDDDEAEEEAREVSTEASASEEAETSQEVANG